MAVAIDRPLLPFHRRHLWPVMADVGLAGCLGQPFWVVVDVFMVSVAW